MGKIGTGRLTARHVFGDIKSSSGPWYSPASAGLSLHQL
jgi:hypothetical protein